MAREDPQVNFRIPMDLLYKLRESQKHSGRSLSAEVVYRLERSFELELRDSLQGSVIALQEKMAESESAIIEMLVAKVLKALPEASANEDGTAKAVSGAAKRTQAKRAQKKS